MRAHDRRANLNDNTDTLVTKVTRPLRCISKVPIDNVEISVADAYRGHSDEDLIVCVCFFGVMRDKVLMSEVVWVQSNIGVFGSFFWKLYMFS